MTKNSHRHFMLSPLIFLYAVSLLPITVGYAQDENADSGDAATNAAAAPVGQSASGLPQAPQASTGEGLNKTIFLDLRDINVVDVLKFLAFEGNLNIVTSKNVQGRSTLLLRNVSIQDALDIIVISNQLAYEVKNGIIYVMTEEEYRQAYGKVFNDKKRIATRSLKYAKPSYVLSALQSLQSELGKTIIDEETGSVIMIDTPEKLAQMEALVDQIEKKRDTEIIKLQYASAKDLETQLKTELDAKAVGSIVGDLRSNQVVVSAYPDRMKEILPVIKSLDAKTKAVLVDVRILQVTINPKYDWGINWEKAVDKLKRGNKASIEQLDFHGSFPIASTVSSSSAIGSVGKISVGKVDDIDEFAVDIRALKQVQRTNILANPKLMILDRQQAKINIGDTLPYVVTTTTGTGTNVSVSEEIKFIDVGIILAVTPFINDDGFITMTIRPEISSKTGVLTTPAKAEIPLVNKTFVESSVVVKDGYTVILGGLRRDDFTEKTLGYPYLMNIPVVGNLFKSRAETTTKNEIVIFITPKIVTGDKNVTGQPLEIKPMRFQSPSIA